MTKPKPRCGDCGKLLAADGKCYNPVCTGRAGQ